VTETFRLKPGLKTIFKTIFTAPGSRSRHEQLLGKPLGPQASSVLRSLSGCTRKPGMLEARGPSGFNVSLRHNVTYQTPRKTDRSAGFQRASLALGMYPETRDAGSPGTERFQCFMASRRDMSTSEKLLDAGCQ